MDVKTVCLGMLTDGEASGYDLKKEFQSSFAHFFAAGYGSIYPALSALAKDGFVECREELQEGKPDRKVYRITDKGFTRLRDELKKPNPSHKVRSEFLATMCFAHLMTNDQLQTVLNNRIKEIDRYLQMFNEFETSGMDDWSPGMQFVCGCGKTVMQALKRYIEENENLLTNEEDSQNLATG